MVVVRAHDDDLGALHGVRPLQEADHVRGRDAARGHVDVQGDTRAPATGERRGFLRVVDRLLRGFERLARAREERLGDGALDRDRDDAGVRERRVGAQGDEVVGHVLRERARGHEHRLRALLARDGRLEAERRERRERRTSRRRRPGRSAGRGRSCPSRRGRRSRRTRGPSRRCRSRRRRRPPRRRRRPRTRAGGSRSRRSRPSSLPAAVSRRFFAPRSTPSMKSKGCIHVPFAPPGARPIFSELLRHPCRGAGALRRARAAALEVVRGEERDVGLDAGGCGRERRSRGRLGQGARGQGQRGAREAAVRNIFIRRSLPRNPRACDRATAPRATGAAAALSLR